MRNEPWTGKAPRQIRACAPVLGVLLIIATLCCGQPAEAVPTAPTIMSVEPSSASTSGGAKVTLAGQGFAADLRVRFGSLDATNVELVTSSQLTCNVPHATPGPVAIQLLRGDELVAELSNQFTYVGTVPDRAPAQQASEPPQISDADRAEQERRRQAALDSYHERLSQEKTAKEAAGQPADATYAGKKLDCLTMGEYGCKIVENRPESEYLTISWKLDLSSACKVSRTVFVEFSLTDARGFQLEKFVDTVAVPANGTASATGSPVVRRSVFLQTAKYGVNAILSPR